MNRPLRILINPLYQKIILNESKIFFDLTFNNFIKESRNQKEKFNCLMMINHIML